MRDKTRNLLAHNLLGLKNRPCCPGQVCVHEVSVLIEQLQGHARKQRGMVVRLRRRVIDLEKERIKLVTEVAQLKHHRSFKVYQTVFTDDDN